MRAEGSSQAPDPSLPSNLAVRSRCPCPVRAPARRPGTPRASPATPARGRRRLSAQLRRRPRPPRAPAGSALRARPVCKCTGPAANGRPSRARPAAPQPLCESRGRDAAPTVARRLAGAAGAFLSARRPLGGAATCRAGPAGAASPPGARGSSPAGRCRWYDPRHYPRRPRRWNSPGASAPSARASRAPPREGRAPAHVSRTVPSRPPSGRASCTHSGAVWLALRGLRFCLV